MTSLPTTDHQRRTLLVTGGAGFIGSNFIRYVLREHTDWTVINLDKLTYAGNLASLTDIEQRYGVSASVDHSSPITDHLSPIPRYYFVMGDICDRPLVDSLLSGEFFAPQGFPPTTHHLLPTAVVSFAAESNVDRSILDATPFVETNISGTQVLLEAARTHWRAFSGQRLAISDQGPVDSSQPSATSRRFIQISTDEVYGALGPTGVFTEDSPLLPNSPYAASKAAADLLCRAYHKAYGLPVVITRSSNNYGPYQFPEKLIPLMVRNALAGEPLPVYGEGKQVRDWLYVEDNCAAIDLVLQKGQPGEAYNIGGSCEKPNIDVVQAICSILEEKLKSNPSLITHHLSLAPGRIPNLESLNPEIRFIDDPRGSAHDFRYALDRSRITQALGWKPKVDFEEGLRRTVDWYLQNQDWVENVVTGEYQAYYERVYGRG